MSIPKVQMINSNNTHYNNALSKSIIVTCVYSQEFRKAMGVSLHCKML